MIEVGRQGKKMSVLEYITTWKWDNTKFETSKNLSHLGAKISAVQKSADDRLKKVMDE